MITLRQAYEKGRRSSATQVDSDVALERFSKKYCPKHSITVCCEFEHAWWNGWEDRYHDDRHAVSCALGIDHPNGHGECDPR